MRWRALPLAALIGCTTATAPQLAAKDCVLTGKAFAEAPRDIREGVVTWAYGTGDGADRRTIVDCASGEMLQLNVTRNQGPLGTRDVSGEVSAWIHSVPEPERLSQLRTAFRAMGLGITENFVTSETCACAVFYPQLRGDKPAYEVRA